MGGNHDGLRDKVIRDLTFTKGVIGRLESGEIGMDVQIYLGNSGKTASPLKNLDLLSQVHKLSVIHFTVHYICPPPLFCLYCVGLALDAKCYMEPQNIVYLSPVLHLLPAGGTFGKAVILCSLENTY